MSACCSKNFKKKLNWVAATPLSPFPVSLWIYSCEQNLVAKSILFLPATQSLSCKLFKWSLARLHFSVVRNFRPCLFCKDFKSKLWQFSYFIWNCSRYFLLYRPLQHTTSKSAGALDILSPKYRLVTFFYFFTLLCKDPIHITRTKMGNINYFSSTEYQKKKIEIEIITAGSFLICVWRKFGQENYMLIATS